MSNILGKNETGFGILIEHDAGYIDINLDNRSLIEKINENYEFKIDEPILINCVLQKWGIENKNGRIYPKEVLIPQANEYQKLIDNNSAVSEADHPESSIISLQNISHKIVKMWWGTGDNENILYGQLKLIVTKGFLKFGIASVIGDKILNYLQNEIKLGISSRGVGTLKEIDGKNLVQDDFELIGFDLVATPSTPGAYLFPVNNKSNNFSENQIKQTNNIFENKISKALNNFLLN